jgi:hypothetical protein
MFDSTGERVARDLVADRVREADRQRRARDVGRHAAELHCREVKRVRESVLLIAREPADGPQEA